MSMTSGKSPPLSELTGTQVQWILGGAMMTLATMPGQTNFIAQFNLSLREAFGLGHGMFGGLYTIATLASACTLIFAGSLADKIAPRTLAGVSIVGLAVTALAMSVVENLVLLVVALAALRFFGQGMLTHIAMTTMSRWFNRFRGRAMSFTTLGYTVGESSLPFVLTLSIGLYGWRSVWAATAMVMVAVLLPVVLFLLRHPPDGARARAGGLINPDGPPASDHLTGNSWTRKAVLRDPLFLAIIPGIMGPPAIGTLFIFHQAHLNEIKDWDLTVFTALFPFLSLTVAIASLLSGFLIDRFGAWRLMPFVLLPLSAGCLLISYIAGQWSIPLVFACLGATQGMMNPIVGALWVELYGSAHIGAIRSLATAALVAASAIGPGISGYLIDLHFELPNQALIYAVYGLVGAGTYWLLQPRFAARVRSLGRV
ncbi:MAG: MFS transporter [Pseudorhizobium sp.]